VAIVGLIDFVFVIIERMWFWFRILTQERMMIVDHVLNAARDNWTAATQLARRATDQPVGGFSIHPCASRRSGSLPTGTRGNGGG